MSGDEAEEIHDLSNPDVTTKYRAAGDIVQKALQTVVEACKGGADIAELCLLGDKVMEEETGKIFNRKVKGKLMEKGVAFPTCVSVNDIVGHFCPWGEDGQHLLKDGDVAKIEMSCHIDGFIAGAGHTVIVGGEAVDDRRADVVMCAWTAAEAALRMVEVGKTNTELTEAWGKIAADFNCLPVQGVVSHEVKKHVIDGSRYVHMAPAQEGESKSEEFTFGVNEAYVVDVIMSTGDGKPRETELKSTVFKRHVDNTYNLRTQKGRQFISEVNRKFPVLPFGLRSFEDPSAVRIGISECRRHELLEEYPVLKDKEGSFVARFKFTVLILPGGSKKITGLPLGILEKQVTTSLSVQDETVKKLLAFSANPKKKKQNNKKKAAAKEGEEGEEDAKES